MTFGMPEARVYTDNYDGPPVVGDYISMLPNLVPLDYEGNKHHHIRMDTMVQEIEVANGVRYRAWTFGGTVPGQIGRASCREKTCEGVARSVCEEKECRSELDMPM